MKTRESDGMKGLYKSPSVKVVDLACCKFICDSTGASTEGYGVEEEYSLSDGDFS